MIGRWVSHALIYLSACSAVSLVWVLLSDGTVDDLKDYARTPADALTVSFWPIWFWLLWGTLVAIHLAMVIGRLLGGRRRRRRGHRAPAAVTKGPRHVVAMFTDLTGSTTLNERLGDEVWAALVADHRRVVRAATAAHGGVEVNTQGDGFFVRFDDPASATECAVDLQARCLTERSEGSALPPIRIGIHQGDAVQEEDDILGRVVNVAARLLEVAEPNEILITEPVADGVGADRLHDRGLVTLKGMTQPRHILAVRWDPDAPSASQAVPRRPATTSGQRERRRKRRKRPRR